MSGRRDPLLYLDDLIEAAERALDYCDGVADSHLLEDPMRRDALMHVLTVMGEAAKQLPAGFRSAHAEVPWSELAKVRDVVVHRYHGVDPEEVRAIVRDDLPRDLPALRAVRDAALADWRARHADAIE